MGRGAVLGVLASTTALVTASSCGSFGGSDAPAEQDDAGAAVDAVAGDAGPCSPSTPFGPAVPLFADASHLPSKPDVPRAALDERTLYFHGQVERSDHSTSRYSVVPTSFFPIPRAKLPRLDLREPRLRRRDIVLALVRPLRTRTATSSGLAWREAPTPSTSPGPATATSDRHPFRPAPAATPCCTRSPRRGSVQARSEPYDSRPSSAGYQRNASLSRTGGSRAQ